MNVWTIYFLTRMEHLREMSQNTLGALGFALVAAFCFGPIFFLDSEKKPVDVAIDILKSKFAKLCGVLITLASLSLVLVPTNKDLAVIFAGAWVTNSEEMKALPDNVVGTLNKFMRNYIDSDEGK